MQLMPSPGCSEALNEDAKLLCKNNNEVHRETSGLEAKLKIISCNFLPFHLICLKSILNLLS